MARRIASLAVLCCAVALLTCARTGIAQTDDAPPPLFENSSTESATDDSAGPALPAPADTAAEKPKSAPAHAQPGRTIYGPSQSTGEYVGKSNARGSQNYHGADQPTYQTADRRAGTNYPQNLNSQYSRSQNAAAANTPSYQQTPRNSAAANSGSTNAPGMNSWRSQWQSQASDERQANGASRQQNSRMQGNYASNYEPSDGRPWGRSQSGNVSASYMPSANDSRNMQKGRTASVMSSNSTPGSVSYGSSGARNPYSANMYADNILPSPPPSQNSTWNRAYSSPRQPMVTPNAVYIDATGASEPIPPGHVTYGKAQMSSVRAGPTMTGSEPTMNDTGEVIGPGQHSGMDGMMMEGPPMDGGPVEMGSGDGFTNPFCNHCNGCGSCAGPAYGPGMGGCCGSCCDDCCDEGGCLGGEHQPYGRPWVLAPLDWIAGELTDCHRGWWWAEDLTAFVGAQNFKNIADGGVTPSFGFQEGVNWGFPVFPDFGLSGQVGYMGVQSEFENPIGSHLQSFLTLGLFHRPWCDECWDAGVVFDWLHDDFFGAGFDVGQIRGQVGWQWNRRNEIGFWFGVNVIDTDAFQTLDQYDFYYRRQFCHGGDFRIWGGFTGTSGATSGGIVGADFEVPLAKRLAIDGGFNYFIPSDSSANGGLRDETWGIGCNLVWYLGGTAECSTPYRPLFDVANNNTLMTILR